MSNAEDATASAELNDVAKEIPDSARTKRGILLKLLIYSGLLGIIFVPSQQNLWVRIGSGKSPS